MAGSGAIHFHVDVFGRVDERNEGGWIQRNLHGPHGPHSLLVFYLCRRTLRVEDFKDLSN